MEHNLTIIPVINKIDLPSADIPMCLEQIDHELGLDSSDAIKVSAKTGRTWMRCTMPLSRRFRLRRVPTKILSPH